MNDNFEETKRKTNGKRGKFELIIGIWTGVVIVLLVSSVSFALVKLNQSVTTQNKNVASGVSPSAVQAEPAPVSNAAISSGSSINVNTVDLFKNQFVYTSDVVNVRSQPSTISRIVVKLKAGTKVQLSKKYDNDWAEIIYNGSKCYIMSKYLSPTAPEASQPNVVIAPTATPRRTSEPKKTPSPTPSSTTKKTDTSKDKGKATLSPSPTNTNNSGNKDNQASSSPTAPSGSKTPTSSNP